MTDEVPHLSPPSGNAALESALDRAALAAILHARGRRRQAQETLGQALPILEEALGTDHYEVGVALDSLATMLLGTGRNHEAVPLFNRAITIFERTLGSAHPRTVACRADRNKAVEGSGQ